MQDLSRRLRLLPGHYSIVGIAACCLDGKSGGSNGRRLMRLQSHVRKSCFLLFILVGLAQAVPAPFDLPGPLIEVKVTRKNKTLVISEVPSLQAGDRIWVHPELPADPAVHYLLIAAFLRGATNPPPEGWFTRAETWSRQMRDEGIVITVPPGAQQALLFLAPETRGDFTTLRSAVRGKPGAFVRAAQELNQVSLDRSRLDAYLNAVRETSQFDPQELRDRSILLARSLNIKLDQQCFDKPSEQQAPCLVQNTGELVLDDGRAPSMITTLTSGAGADMIGQLSVSRVAGGGVYSAYVGAAVDLARMLENLRTAEYQYIPALALPKRAELNLKLNNAPSFHKPMSVLVIALPEVGVVQSPNLRPVNPNEMFCLQRPSLVLPVEGSPLVFSTDIAHDFWLHIKSKARPGIEVPATADPASGGVVVETGKLGGASLDPQSTGVIHGYWGFEPFTGPSFSFSSSHPRTWAIPSSEQTTLVVGRNDTLHLQSDDATCVRGVTLKDQQKEEIQTSWKLVRPGEMEVQIPLEKTKAGPVTVEVKQYGLEEPDEVHLQAYSEAGHLEDFAINAGDRGGILRGTRLDEIASVELRGIRFNPGDLSRANGKDELRLTGSEEARDAFHTGDKLTARISWKDGRVRDLATTVQSPRPKVGLIAKTIDLGPTALAIRLGSHDELPQDGKLSFVFRSETPELFPRSEKIEVETEDGSFDVLLGFDDGSLTLEDSRNVLVEMDPLKSFGRSCFGALRFRPVEADGKKGDWQPLAILVRVPVLTEIHCLKNEKQCALSGSNLFLISSVASDPEFTNNVYVPVGFMDSTLIVPRPVRDFLYIRLRDDPLIMSIATPPGIPSDQRSSANRRRRPDTPVN